MTRVKLHLGCGHNYMPTWVNVDRRADVKTDLCFDLNSHPWPWPDDSVDEIWMDQTLEHLPDTIKVIEEIHRILKRGGACRGLVPFAGSIWAFQDPTHAAFFTERSFVYFDKNRPLGTPKYSTAEFSEVRTSLEANSVSWMNRARNLIPFRPVLRWFLWNCYDNVRFELVK